MKRIIPTLLVLTALSSVPLFAAGGNHTESLKKKTIEDSIFGHYDIEFKPMAFYYEVDPYLPVKVLLEGSGFILDPGLNVQIERTVGLSAFMADPGFLRSPVITDIYNLDEGAYSLEVGRYTQKSVASWEVQILDMTGISFRTISGKGSLPEEIPWDGRGDDGSVLSVGDVYTYNVRLTTRDGSTVRKGGGTIDISGVAYENVVSVKESEIHAGNIYSSQVSRKTADYYQLVMNRFKEGGYGRITVTASELEAAEDAREYLAPSLVNVPIDVLEDPEHPCIRFEFE